MSEIFSNIEAMIILYAPTALMFITQFIDWFVSLRRLTKLNVNKQIEPLLIKVNTLVNETKKYKAEVDAIRQENAELLAYIKENQIVTQEVNKSLEECKEFMKALSAENVELKAELRRKVCEAKEQENV